MIACYMSTCQRFLRALPFRQRSYVTSSLIMRIVLDNAEKVTKRPPLAPSTRRFSIRTRRGTRLEFAIAMGTNW